MASQQEEKAALEAELERMATMPPLENPKVFYWPEEQTAKSLKTIEKQTNGPLPLALRSWYRHVGYVSFAGSHPVLNPAASATADPLVVRPAAEIMMGVPIPGDVTEVSVADIMEEQERARKNGKKVLTISESDRSKAGLQGGKQCKIWLPEPSADLELRNLWRPITFVAYLRSAFEWGGFRGWERDPSLPRDAVAEFAFPLSDLRIGAGRVAAISRLRDVHLFHEARFTACAASGAVVATTADVPDLDRLIRAGDGQCVALRGKSGGGDRLAGLVDREAGQQLTTLGVPQSGIAANYDDDEFGVRREFDEAWLGSVSGGPDGGTR